MKQPKAPWTTVPAFVARTKNGLRQPKTCKRPRQVAVKRQAMLVIYRKLVRKFLVTFRRCNVYPEQQAVEVHHLRGRTGSLLLDKRYWLAVSRAGHLWIHAHPEMARRYGWLCERGDWGKP